MVHIQLLMSGASPTPRAVIIYAVASFIFDAGSNGCSVVDGGGPVGLVFLMSLCNKSPGFVFG
jgi:hypothetical protein